MLFVRSRIARTPVFGGASYDAATIAWANAVVSAGGTVSGTQKGFVDTLIKGLKTDGLFSVMDRVWLLASENTTQANIDIINLQTWTYHGTPSLATQFSANHGITGDGSTVYLDTNYIPSVGPNYTQNSASHGAYDLTVALTSAAHGRLVGVNDGPEQSELAFETAGFVVHNLNTAAATPAFSTVTSDAGLWLGSRTGSAGASDSLYKNGSSIASGSGTSVGVPTISYHAFAFNTGSPSGFLADQLAAIFFGGGLNATQALNFSTRLNAYMTSLGVNVYP